MNAKETFHLVLLQALWNVTFERIVSLKNVKLKLFRKSYK